MKFILKDSKKEELGIPIKMKFDFKRMFNEIPTEFYETVSNYYMLDSLESKGFKAFNLIDFYESEEKEDMNSDSYITFNDYMEELIIEVENNNIFEENSFDSYNSYFFSELKDFLLGYTRVFFEKEKTYIDMSKNYEEDLTDYIDFISEYDCEVDDFTSEVYEKIYKMINCKNIKDFKKSMNKEEIINKYKKLERKG